jgi:hypothetical protein
MPASIDYHTPRWTLREAAATAGYDSVNTLRAYYQRGHFRIVGGEAAKARGLSSLLNLRDVLHLAVAGRLIDVGVHPRHAFDAGRTFAHSGDERRDPAKIYDPREGFTVLIYRPRTGRADVQLMGAGDTLGFTDLFVDTALGGRGAAVVILLNDVERDVFSAAAERLFKEVLAPARERETA